MPIATLPPDTRLLLIDDHQIYLDGLTLTLNSLCQGITLDHARTAGEAMEQVSRHTYDLILLDLHLPDGNGLHLLEKLHAVDPLTPVAILTGSNNPSDMDAALKRGAAGFISKRSEEHTSELQSRPHLVCRLLLEKKKAESKSLPPRCPI